MLIETDTIGFLFAFHSIYDGILYNVQDIVTY